MSASTLQSFFLWCAAINYGLLILWFVLIRLPHPWLYNLSGKPFRMSEEQFDALNLAGIIAYKIAIIMFALVPYIALRLSA
ncbi:MAG TPA: hypothetical protein VKT78_09805 [Fimbriimonadaceae bacterium]|nr:hypothetical protein [Fimbriimonadaceae bacterium]